MARAEESVKVVGSTIACLGVKAPYYAPTTTPQTPTLTPVITSKHTHTKTNQPQKHDMEEKKSGPRMQSTPPALPGVRHKRRSGQPGSGGGPPRAPRRTRGPPPHRRRRQRPRVAPPSAESETRSRVARMKHPALRAAPNQAGQNEGRGVSKNGGAQNEHAWGSLARPPHR